MRLSLIQQAIAELSATRCYCGAGKGSGKSFCGKCYFSLPKKTQSALYKQINEGYASIYDEAKEWLRLNTERINPAFSHEIKET